MNYNKQITELAEKYSSIIIPGPNRKKLESKVYQDIWNRFIEFKLDYLLTKAKHIYIKKKQKYSFKEINDFYNNQPENEDLVNELFLLKPNYKLELKWREYINVVDGNNDTIFSPTTKIYSIEEILQQIYPDDVDKAERLKNILNVVCEIKNSFKLEEKNICKFEQLYNKLAFVFGKYTDKWLTHSKFKDKQREVVNLKNLLTGSKNDGKVIIMLEKLAIDSLLENRDIHRIFRIIDHYSFYNFANNSLVKLINFGKDAVEEKSEIEIRDINLNCIFRSYKQNKEFFSGESINTQSENQKIIYIRDNLERIYSAWRRDYDQLLLSIFDVSKEFIKQKKKTKYTVKEFWKELLYHTKGSSHSNIIENCNYNNKNYTHQTVSKHLERMKPYLKNYITEDEFSKLDKWQDIFDYHKNDPRIFEDVWRDYYRSIDKK